VQSSNLTVFCRNGHSVPIICDWAELTIERLMAMRMHVFGFGTMQVVITAILIIIICKHLANTEASIILAVHWPFLLQP